MTCPACIPASPLMTARIGLNPPSSHESKQWLRNYASCNISSIFLLFFSVHFVLVHIYDFVTSGVYQNNFLVHFKLFFLKDYFRNNFFDPFSSSTLCLCFFSKMGCRYFHYISTGYMGMKEGDTWSIYVGDIGAV